MIIITIYIYMLIRASIPTLNISKTNRDRKEKN